MKYKRIIARLDIKGPNLVKGIHMEGLRVIGDPESFAKHYYDLGIDEIIYQDVVASLFQRNSIIKTIKKTAKQILVPLTVGGGIRSIRDIYEILNAGADKVSINTITIKKPQFINLAAKKFGSSTIVVAIESSKSSNGKYYALTDNGREETKKEVVEWAQEIEKRGAGEILLTSIDKDGTGEGFDFELINLVSNAVKIPVIAHGGAGKYEDVKEILDTTKIDGVAISSLFHYSTIKKIKNNFSSSLEGNFEFIKNYKNFKNFGKYNLPELKKFLIKQKVFIRN
jgi:imidazole glycerol-phosphate synthase subunit HisF